MLASVRWTVCCSPRDLGGFRGQGAPEALQPDPHPLTYQNHGFHAVYGLPPFTLGLAQFNCVSNEMSLVLGLILCYSVPLRNSLSTNDEQT